MNDDEKWSAFQEALSDADKYKKACEDEKAIAEDLRNQINGNTDFLKKDKSFIPKFGFSAGASAGFDNLPDIDVMIKVDFYIFVTKNFFISPGGYFKPYSRLGGGIEVSFGGVW